MGILEQMNAKIDSLVTAQTQAVALITELIALVKNTAIDQAQIDAINVRLDGATKALVDAVNSYVPGA